MTTTKRAALWIIAFAAVAGLFGRSLAISRAAEPLRLVGTIPLVGVEGRIDHFGRDATRQRLFVAGLGNNSVEVIDLDKGEVAKHLTGLKTPQGIGVSADGRWVGVANDADGSFRIFDGASLKEVNAVDLKDDADNVRFDAATKLFWVGYGSGGLAAVDPESGKIVQDIKLDAHPESFQLETKGKRIFVNVTRAHHIAVIDRDKGVVTAKWPVKEAEANFPMALDETGRRLFVGCRKPAKLLVLDTDSGRTSATVEIVGDTDDLFYDANNKRVYISGGQGRITVVEQSGPDTYGIAGQVATALGARTSFFVPESDKLYVAVPHRGSQPAELRVFKVQPAK
jgi:DNA-binding beta-propeller fold protein YncE